MNPLMEKGSVPMLIVLSGPSGVGKDAVLSRMKGQDRPYYYAVTATTRAQRKNEINGKDYIFISENEFRDMIGEDELLEWAEVYGNLYGVPKTQVIEALIRGYDVVVKTDVQGASTIKQLMPEAVLIFLSVSSADDLKERLSGRMTESEESLKTRLHTAESEMKDVDWFDHVVLNETGKLDETVFKIEEAISIERKVKSRNVLDNRGDLID